MIVALLNRKAASARRTLALHLAGQWARQGKRITLIDADPQGSALDWSEQRARRRHDRLFGVIGLARDTLHREAPGSAVMPITSSLTGRRASPHCCARHCSPLTSR